MDHDWVVAFDIEDADLEQRPIRCWAYEHRQVVVEAYSSHRVAHGMPDVRLGDPVLSRCLADPHLDNIACLADDIGSFAPSVPDGYTKLSGSARTTAGFAQRTALSTDAGGCERQRISHPCTGFGRQTAARGEIDHHSENVRQGAFDGAVWDSALASQRT